MSANKLPTTGNTQYSPGIWPVRQWKEAAACLEKIENARLAAPHHAKRLEITAPILFSPVASALFAIDHGRQRLGPTAPRATRNAAKESQTVTRIILKIIQSSTL